VEELNFHRFLFLSLVRSLVRGHRFRRVGLLACGARYVSFRFIHLRLAHFAFLWMPSSIHLTNYPPYLTRPLSSIALGVLDSDTFRKIVIVYLFCFYYSYRVNKELKLSVNSRIDACALFR
jgi:hypothetical protein